MKSTFIKESFYSASGERVFRFHERPDAFTLLTPADHDVEVLSTASTLAPSDEVVRFVVSFLFLKFRFEMVHTVYEPFDLFVDQQQRGLFSSWTHRHEIRDAGAESDPAARLRDQIDFAHPLLPFFGPFVRRRLKQLFEFRHRKTGEELAAETRGENAEVKTVVVTGATGLIGRRITEILEEKGHRVVAFARNVERAREMLGDGVTAVRWDFDAPDSGEWRRHLEGARGVIHLAGTPLFEKRWTADFKKKMEESRVLSTRQLVDAIRKCDDPPGVFVSASAVGIYGMDPGLVCDEDTKAADDLLARICVNWEDEARKLDADGVRTAQIRIGIVLDARAGVLKEVVPLFKSGIGGTLGLPHPTINWIHLEDVARIFVMALFDDGICGPFNAVAPNPVTNEAFAGSLARVLRRPALMKHPVGFLKLVIGEAAAYSSGGPRVRSKKIQEVGYRFFFDDLEPALKNALGR